MKLKQGFIEKVDDSEFTLYADTDSSYNLVPLPFNKFDDDHKTVAYSQKIALELNREYRKIFEETIIKFGNVDPDYNFMNFKSEIVAYRGMFNAKKTYGLTKIWDEGTFYNPPDVKKIGGQIVKADSTPVVLDLLTEVYGIILMDFSITNEIELYRKIFYEVKSKYTTRIEKAVETFDILEFGIPKKWSLKELKTIPKQVSGAMFYNYIINNNIRPGDSVLQCQIIINPSKLNQHMSKYSPNSKYQLSIEMISKLNVISFPSDINQETIDKVFKVFQELNIQLDLRTILDFNINLKLDAFKKLFNDETIRLAV